MTGVREHFTDLRDPEVRVEIALGDDTYSHGCWAWHNYFSEREYATHFVQGCVVCPWV
jgi:hypothetical protein